MVVLEFCDSGVLRLSCWSFGGGTHLGPCAVGVKDVSAGMVSVTMKLPMIQDGTFALTESSAIAEFIDESCDGPRLFPPELKLRARARQIQAWLRSNLAVIRRERPSESIFYPAVLPPLTREAEQMTQRLYAAAEAWLADQQHVCGEWCIADVDLAVMLTRLIRNGDAVPTELAQYAERQWERPSMRAWLDMPRGRQPSRQLAALRSSRSRLLVDSGMRCACWVPLSPYWLAPKSCCSF